MIDQELRTATFALRGKGQGMRVIARALGLSRNTVREILRSGQVAVPAAARADLTEPHADLVRDLYARCEGGTGCAWPRSWPSARSSSRTRR